MPHPQPLEQNSNLKLSDQSQRHWGCQKLQRPGSLPAVSPANAQDKVSLYAMWFLTLGLFLGKKKKSSRFAFSKMSTLLENSLSKKERRALLLMGSQILEGIGYSRFLKLAPGLHQETLAKSADKCGCHNWGRGCGSWKERQGVGFLLPCQSLCDSVSALIQRKWVGSPKLGRSRSFQKEP